MSRNTKNSVRILNRKNSLFIFVSAFLASYLGLYFWSNNNPNCVSRDFPSVEIKPQFLTANTGARSKLLGNYGGIQYHNNIDTNECCSIISHAAGGVRGLPYTNSLEALESNYALGRRIFELDFLETCDGEIVLAHDWNAYGNRAPTSEEFLARKIGEDLTPVDLERLIIWMQKRPDTIIVTDSKYDFDRFIGQLSARIPLSFLENRFVIQTYNFENFQTTKAISARQGVIFTTYRSNLSDVELIQKINEHQPDGLTIPLNRALESLADFRKSLPNLPIFVHGSPSKINSHELHKYLKENGASGIYAD